MVKLSQIIWMGLVESQGSYKRKERDGQSPSRPDDQIRGCSGVAMSHNAGGLQKWDNVENALSPRTSTKNAALPIS